MLKQDRPMEMHLTQFYTQSSLKDDPPTTNPNPSPK